MAELYNKPLKKTDDWGGVINSVGKRLPASGKTVLAFIKESLQKRIGYIYEDEQNKKYIGFADVEDYESYFNDNPDNTKFHNEELIVQRWDLPRSGIGYIYEDTSRGEYLAFVGREEYELYIQSLNENLILQTWRVPENQIVQGTTPPGNHNYLWVDTNKDTPEYRESILNAVSYLLKLVDTLMHIRTAGAISGTVSDGTRTHIISEADPQIPDILYDEYLELLNQLLEEGVFGDPRDETNTEYQAAKQDLIERTYNEEDGQRPNYSEGEEPTVSHVTIKVAENYRLITSNINNLVNGELVFNKENNKLFIIMDGGTIAISGSASSSDGDSSDMNEQQITNRILEELSLVLSIGFVPIGSSEAEYTAKVNNEGKFLVYKKELDDWAPAPSGDNTSYYEGVLDNAAAEGLLINSLYLGGKDKDEHSYLPCSHNFIELSNILMDSNGNYVDINLNGFSLLYCEGDSDSWYELPLWGTIKGGGTFLIRGALCSVMDSNITKIKVKNYDMEWKVDNELISFSQDKAVFYICWKHREANGTTKFYDYSGNLLNELSKNHILNMSNTSQCAKGYVDLFSFNNTTLAEGGNSEDAGTYILPVGTSASEVIFRRWYMLDPVSLSNPKGGISKHNNKEYMSSTFLNAANISEYSDITDFTPKASFEGKTIATTRSLFLETEPNTLTCTFGIQATDNTTGGGLGATRGFCWNSVGYFNEYLLYREKTTPESEWIEVESMKEELSASQYIAQHPGVTFPLCVNNDYYKEFTRRKWETAYGLSITTHKVLISGLTDINANANEGTVYEYKVVRKDELAYQDGYQVQSDYTYQSKVREFTVRKDSKVNSFKFVLVTDQQGANWEEYEVWNLSAKIIEKAENNGTIANYDFILNTGDICYNGSRSNEWIDYYRGYEPLDNKEEMLTIGNNDLAPINLYEIGNGKESPFKINVNIIDYFYCTEIDTRNPCIFNGTKGNKSVTYKIPSLYSFNYGPYHFMSLISEIRTGSNKAEKQDDGTYSEKAMKKGNTVNTIFGIDDNSRPGNTQATLIYDVVEEWMIKDLLLWKGNSSFTTRDEMRYSNSIVGQCSKCIVFTHEMPFNIISSKSYKNYKDGQLVGRETAKAYLNRHHNYEFLRLFKLWGIRLIMGGHKHTPAVTYPVYDAPLYYNPLLKSIDNNEIAPVSQHISHNGLTEDIMNDSSNEFGLFNNSALFLPFMQLTPALFSSKWNTLKDFCKEIYNNTASSITVGGKTFAPLSLTTNTITNDFGNKPILRIEIIDNINAPSYIMCQATGFKNVSNSDLAAPTIPWEQFHTPGIKNNLNSLLYPFFTIYSVTPTNIDVKMYKITGMYLPDENETGNNVKPGYWDLNKIYNKVNTGAETLEENRLYYVDHCAIELYNNTGTSANPVGTTINLS